MHAPSQPFDVTAAFAAPNSNSSLRSGQSLDALQVALPSKSLSILRIAKIFILGHPFLPSTVAKINRCFTVVNAPFRCKVQNS